MPEKSATLEAKAGEDFLKMLEEMNDYVAKIPKDKDCKKCPYSDEGHSRGMVSPCFDLCDEIGLNVESYSQPR